MSDIKTRFLVILFSALSGLSLPVAHAAPSGHSALPSFDCTRASVWAEQTVCANEALAELDILLDDIYRRLRHNQIGNEVERLKASQFGWIKLRDDCHYAEEALACLFHAYSSRLGFLARSLQQVAAASPLTLCTQSATVPEDVTQCLKSTLESIEAVLVATEKSMGPDVSASSEAWARYRDKECTRVFEMADPAQKVENIKLNCKIMLTRQRVSGLQLP